MLLADYIEHLQIEIFVISFERKLKQIIHK